MDYCLGADGAATMWSGPADVDIDGDGTLDGIGLDFDGDGLRDDVLADLDGDGLADHAILDAGGAQRWFTDDGTGTWSIAATERSPGAGLRWQSLDGVEQSGGPLVDFDDDGAVDDRLVDTDGNRIADRVIAVDGSVGYVDNDLDGGWDVKLLDEDGDGAADSASQL